MSDDQPDWTDPSIWEGSLMLADRTSLLSIFYRVFPKLRAYEESHDKEDQEVARMLMAMKWERAVLFTERLRDPRRKRGPKPKDADDAAAIAAIRDAHGVGPTLGEIARHLHALDPSAQVESIKRRLRRQRQADRLRPRN